jgi:hypothetical protein
MKKLKRMTEELEYKYVPIKSRTPGKSQLREADIWLKKGRDYDWISIWVWSGEGKLFNKLQKEGARMRFEEMIDVA